MCYGQIHCASKFWGRRLHHDIHSSPDEGHATKSQKGTFNILSNEKAWLLSFSPASSSISAAYWVSLKNGYELNWHIRLIQTQTERPTALKEIHLNTEINKWATYHPVNLKLYLNDIFSDFFFSPEASGGTKKGGKKKGSSFQTVSALFRVRRKLFLTLSCYFVNLFLTAQVI